MANRNAPEIISLTRREMEVLRLLSKGYTTPLIAAELGIGKETVLSYRKQLHQKFNVSRVGELIYKATELDLI